MMRTKSIIVVLLLAAAALAVIRCGSESSPKPATPAHQEEVVAPAAPTEDTAQADATETNVDEADVTKEIVTETKIEVQEVSGPATEAETTAVEAEKVVKIEGETAEEAVEVEAPAEADVEPVEEVAAAESDDVVQTDEVVEEAAEPVDIEAVEFTATTGLDQFSAYRMNFEADFDGTRQNQPTAGTLGGLFEATKNPQATHWQINMDGNTFNELAILGGTMELYDLGSTIYIQNPQGGGFIGVPAMFIESMLPGEMYNPEDSIELPATAVPQPGKETINGVATQRYTFGKDDMAKNRSELESVDGTIWVAVDGNYVVKYEATVSGTFSGLSAGGMDVLDKGTIAMSYKVTDVNEDFSIDAPAGAQAIDLTSLLFN